jgi:outer membrane protein assembly factor BamB
LVIIAVLHLHCSLYQNTYNPPDISSIHLHPRFMIKALFSFSRKLQTVAAFSLISLSQALNAADWTQYRGPDYNGATSETINTSKLMGKASWKVDTPNGFSSFAVANGIAATLISREDQDGLIREACLAVDAKSGNSLWSIDLGRAEYGHDGGNAGAKGNTGGDGPRSTPTISDGKIFVYDADLNLYAFDAKSGKTLWKKRIEKDFDGRQIKWKNATSPIIDGNLVIVAGGGAGQTFLAFNKSSGDLVWKSGDTTLTHATPTIANIHGVRQVIFFMTSGLVGVDISSGKILWEQSHPFKVSTAASPIVDGEYIYCSAGYGVGGGLYKVSKSGSKFSSKNVWFKKDVVNHWSTPVLHNGHIYGMFGFKKYGNGPLKCIELATGNEKWSTDGFGPGNVTLTGDGKLLALGDDGSLVVAEATPTSYKEIARAKVVSGKCWSTPTLAYGHIFARSTKEAICLNVSH